MHAAARPVARVLPEAERTGRAAAHRARVDRWVAPHLERRRQGRFHPVLDFLFAHRSGPSDRLRRRHPGAGSALAGETARLRCTHVDAYRFSTRSAAPRNALRPTRWTQVEPEQPGCLHDGMDLPMDPACM